MKTRFLFTLVLLLAMPLMMLACGPTQAVIAAFSQAYPSVDVKTVRWSGGHGQPYVANFSLEGKSATASFDATGILQETASQVDPETLPAAAREYVAKNCAAPVIHEAMVTRDASGTVKGYAATACTNVRMVFDKAGTFVQ